MKKLLLFSKEDCAPCKMVKQLLNNEGGEDFIDINIEQNPDKVSEFGIMSVPVAVLIDENEKEISRSQGFNPPQLMQLIEQLNSQ